jgi:hypothetical protein
VGQGATNEPREQRRTAQPAQRLGLGSTNAWALWVRACSYLGMPCTVLPCRRCLLVCLRPVDMVPWKGGGGQLACLHTPILPRVIQGGECEKSDRQDRPKAQMAGESDSKRRWHGRPSWN